MSQNGEVDALRRGRNECPAPVGFLVWSHWTKPGSAHAVWRRKVVWMMPEVIIPQREASWRDKMRPS